MLKVKPCNRSLCPVPILNITVREDSLPINGNDRIKGKISQNLPLGQQFSPCFKNFFCTLFGHVTRSTQERFIVIFNKQNTQKRMNKHGYTVTRSGNSQIESHYWEQEVRISFLFLTCKCNKGKIICKTKDMP